MNHETHIPTQQTPPQENNRFQSSHENSRGPKGHQPTPPSRPKEISRLIFPKAVRLRTRGEFQRVAREGKRLVGRYLCVDCRPAAKARLGISASSRYGSSPERNRFKRLIREAFRQGYHSLPALDLNVIPRQCAKQASCANIREELTRLLTPVVK
jgi:ribonuclease P protein component